MEESTDSVAKGVFLFKNSFKHKAKCGHVDPEEIYNPFSENLWYLQYRNIWTDLEYQIKDISTEIFSSMTQDVIDFLKNSHVNPPREVPTAVLLTGINMPDHVTQFKTLEDQIKSKVSPHVACLNSQEGSGLKYIIENMIGQFIQTENKNLYLDEHEFDATNKPAFKKSSLCFGMLQIWYENLLLNGARAKKEENPLVIIIPEFESFNVKVLKSFILIISSYIEKLPFVFVFGVSTSLNTLQTSFPYHVIAKISIKVFKYEKSIEHLNRILEEVFFSTACPVQFGPKVFILFTDIFLFYDFSVNNFVQNMKYTIMEHFCYGNAMSLCSLDRKEINDIIFTQLDHADLENVRQLTSFQKLLESENEENKAQLLTNDEYFKTQLFVYVTNMQKYIRRLHIFLKCLHVFVADLPGSPMGKFMREIYPIVLHKGGFSTSAEFSESFQLLNFLSKDEMKKKLGKVAEIIYTHLNKNTQKTELKEIHKESLNWIQKLDNIDQLNTEESDTTENQDFVNNFAKLSTNRKALKEALLNQVKIKPKLNKYEKLREEILNFLRGIFTKFLSEPRSLYFHEIFFFDDEISIKNKIIGSHRSAIHQALSNPYYYLQCKCCEIPNNTSIKSSMPDISIAYKLHLECGKMINLYDWLQAFLCVLNPTEQGDDDSKIVVDPELQARFTQCVAELEHLGFIKSSKRKLDHVARLTWGA